MNACNKRMKGTTLKNLMKYYVLCTYISGKKQNYSSSLCYILQSFTAPMNFNSFQENYGDVT